MTPPPERPTRSFLPLSGLAVPRYAGVPSFMRLPLLSPEDAHGVEIGLVGVPWDGGTTNRPGARHGPRQLRDLSTMVRLVNQATGARPFHTANCADLGDVPVNPADLADTIARIAAFYRDLKGRGIAPMTAVRRSA
jgi:guanidinopropionase